MGASIYHQSMHDVGINVHFLDLRMQFSHFWRALLTKIHFHDQVLRLSDVTSMAVHPHMVEVMAQEVAPFETMTIK